MDTAREHERRRGVPHVVHPDSGRAGSHPQCKLLAFDHGSTQRTPIRTSEDEADTRIPLVVASERLDCIGAELDLTP